MRALARNIVVKSLIPLRVFRLEAQLSGFLGVQDRPPVSRSGLLGVLRHRLSELGSERDWLEDVAR